MKVKTESILANALKVVAFLALAYYISMILIEYAESEITAPLMFIVAIVFIARYTDGYAYGALAAVLSMVIVNYSFMYPYDFFTMSISGYPLIGGSFVLASVTVSTLTTRLRRETEENRKLFQKQMEMRVDAEKSKTRENLLRAISHDLRTPLTAILGASSVIENNYDRLSRDDVIKFAQGIGQEAHWLIDMVENLLSVTRVNGEAANIIKRNEIFEEIIAGSIQKIRARFPKQKISVKVPKEVLVVPMDSILITQVIFNLTENAIKHSEVDDAVEISLSRADDMAVCEIRDHGKGIRFDNVDALIENVARDTEKAQDSTRGLGLGLSVCKSIIKAHGGFIEAESPQDGGAIFRFGLKLAEDDDRI